MRNEKHNLDYNSSFLFPTFAEEVPPVPCSSDEHRQFDFWLGEWTSYSKDGKKQGTNHLTKPLGLCVLQENWTDVFDGCYQGDKD